MCLVYVNFNKKTSLKKLPNFPNRMVYFCLDKRSLLAEVNYINPKKCYEIINFHY